VSSVLERSIDNLKNEFTSAAEAMPEDKYSFAPSNGEFRGVRTFAQQIKHVAADNYFFASAILGEKPPGDGSDEDGPANITSKADVLKYLSSSFEYVHRAVLTINEKNMVEPIKSPFGVQSVTRLGLATAVSAHGFDHYGQMVLYLRMNGIIPPASR